MYDDMVSSNNSSSRFLVQKNQQALLVHSSISNMIRINHFDDNYKNAVVVIGCICTQMDYKKMCS